LPKYFAWLDALSVIKYTYVGISLNELRGLKLTCTPSQLVNGVCPVTSGQVTIDNLGLDELTIGGCVGALLAMIVGFRVLAYIGLRWRK
jgi:ATP-binding cassette subfamily G (WHITE) protein 2